MNIFMVIAGVAFALTHAFPLERSNSIAAHVAATLVLYAPLYTIGVWAIGRSI